MTSVRCRGEEPNRKKYPLDHLFEWSTSVVLVWLKLLVLTGELSSYIFVVHSCDELARAFPVFHHSSAFVYYTERKLRTKKGPGNKAYLHMFRVKL